MKLSPEERKEKRKEVKRTTERRMSICLKRFPISGLGEHNIYHDLGVFYKEVGRLWKESAPELMGVK